MTHLFPFIAQSLFALWINENSPLFTSHSLQAHHAQRSSHTHTALLLKNSPTSLHLVSLWAQKQHKVPNTERKSTHWGKKQLVNNWHSQSATLLSEGTAWKHHRRKVKAPTSNYLSPKAIAAEAKCYWREPTWWTSLEESLMRCCRQIQYYISDCIFWWSRSWR